MRFEYIFLYPCLNLLISPIPGWIETKLSSKALTSVRLIVFLSMSIERSIHSTGIMIESRISPAVDDRIVEDLFSLFPISTKLAD
jgi:hypothetical protein